MICSQVKTLMERILELVRGKMIIPEVAALTVDFLAMKLLVGDMGRTTV